MSGASTAQLSVGGKKLGLLCWVATAWLLGFPSLAHAQLGRDPRIVELERGLTLFSASIGSGARALAMGGAFIAIADDGTAASWNPAGLGVLEETEISLNWQPLFSESLRKPPLRVVTNGAATTGVLFADTGSTDLSRTAQSLDFLSLAVPFRVGGRKIVPQFSYHSVVPSLDAEFDATPSEVIAGCGEDCQLRQVTEGTATVQSEGGIDVYAASVGIPLRQNLRLGVSLNWWRGDTRTKIDDTSISTQLTSRDGEDTEARNFSTVEESDALSGFNANVGMILELNRWVHMGAVFKTPFSMDREASAANTTSVLLRNLSDPSNPAYQPLFLDISLESEGEINWPATFGFGFAWFPASAVTVSTDFTWSNWSEVRYDHELTVRSSFSEPTTTHENESYPAQMQVDAWQYRLGAELVLFNPSFAKMLAVPLRGGFFLDRQYFLDFQGNTILNRGVSAGAGLVWSKLTLDFAYMYSFAPREPSAPVEGVVRDLADSGVGGSLEVFQQEPGEGKFSRHQVLVTAIVRF